LQERSLVLSEQAGSETRFRMLESLREFAERQLRPAERVALQQFHADYFLALAEEAAPELRGKVQQAWLDKLDTEHDNLRAALAWSQQVAADIEAGPRLAGVLWTFWYSRGHLREGRVWMERMLTEPASPDVRARLTAAAGVLALTYTLLQVRDAPD